MTMRSKMEVKMVVKMGVKVEVKKDNTFVCNKTFVLFNSLFNFLFNSQLNTTSSFTPLLFSIIGTLYFLIVT